MTDMYTSVHQHSDGVNILFITNPLKSQSAKTIDINLFHFIVYFIIFLFLLRTMKCRQYGYKRLSKVNFS